jgi:hypothetical protein
MPTLDWIGKNTVIGHHKEVPYRLIKCDKELSAGAAFGEIGLVTVSKLNVCPLRACKCFPAIDSALFVFIQAIYAQSAPARKPVKHYFLRKYLFSSRHNT